MSIHLLFLGLFFGLFILSYLISLRYRKKTVNVEKLKVCLGYMSVIFTTMLATRLSLHFVNDNIDLIRSWTGNSSLNSYLLVNFMFIFVLIIPVAILFFTTRWKKKNLL